MHEWILLHLGESYLMTLEAIHIQELKPVINTKKVTLKGSELCTLNCHRDFKNKVNIFYLNDFLHSPFNGITFFFTSTKCQNPTPSYR